MPAVRKDLICEWFDAPVNIDCAHWKCSMQFEDDTNYQYEIYQELARVRFVNVYIQPVYTLMNVGVNQSETEWLIEPNISSSLRCMRSPKQSIWLQMYIDTLLSMYRPRKFVGYLRGPELWHD